MRGKLRDKRTQSKRDSFKRDMFERRRQPRRENRSMIWLNQQLDEEYDDDLEETEGEVVLQAVAKPVRQ